MCHKMSTLLQNDAEDKTEHHDAKADRERVIFSLFIGSQRISSAQPPEAALGLNTQSECSETSTYGSTGSITHDPLSHNKSYTWALTDSWFTAGVRH